MAKREVRDHTLSHQEEWELARKAEDDAEIREEMLAIVAGMIFLGSLAAIVWFLNPS